MLTPDLIRSAIALAAVIGLLLAARPLIRRLQPGTARRADPSLGIVGTLALDRARRLTLVSCAGRTALVLTGGTSDRLIPWPPGGGGEAP